MSNKPKSKVIPVKPTQQKTWPTTISEREACRSLLAQRAQIDARLNAIWNEAAKRIGVPAAVDVHLEPSCAEWIMRQEVLPPVVPKP